MVAAPAPAAPVERARPADPGPYRRTSVFRPDATNEWDRMPAELQRAMLNAAGPFTKFVNGLLLAAELRALPKQQLEQLWQDASDADWKGRADHLPWTDITSTSLKLRRSLLDRIAAKHRAMHVFRVATRNSWTDMLDFERCDDLSQAAALEGAVWLLDELIEKRRTVAPSMLLVHMAASGGHLDAVRFLIERIPHDALPYWVGASACESGNLDLVIWLKEHHVSCLGPSALAGATRCNHMHIARWLVENTDVECDVRAFELAASSDNLEMLQFLLEHFPNLSGILNSGGDFVSADMAVISWLDERGLLNSAELVSHCVKMGKIDVLEWTLMRFGVVLEEKDLEYAFHVGHDKLLRWAYERGVPFTNASAGWAAKSCSTSVMSWIISRDRGMTSILVEETARLGDPSLVEWWRIRHGIAFGQQELETAILCANSPLVKLLLAMDDVDWDLEAARTAAARVPLSRNRIMQDAIDAAAARRDARAETSSAE
ncbi:hypothetical protein HK105_208757 [Polyrhizophydium stewartii]|uniref:Ankyrin repeat protein n=1 Tax=Polyrhizophydium stewartii TaxID=2732419 RepID=A0ABR4MWV0_9FUNG